MHVLGSIVYTPKDVVRFTGVIQEIKYIVYIKVIQKGIL